MLIHLFVVALVLAFVFWLLVNYVVPAVPAEGPWQKLLIALLAVIVALILLREAGISV